MVDMLKEDSKVIKSIVYNLFEEIQLERHTYLENEEIAIFDVLLSLGETNDNYQKKYMNKSMDFKCNLTILAQRGLRLRTSRKGWRSDQTVEIAQSEYHKEEIQEEGKLSKIAKIFKKE